MYKQYSIETVHQYLWYSIMHTYNICKKIQNTAVLNFSHTLIINLIPSPWYSSTWWSCKKWKKLPRLRFKAQHASTWTYKDHSVYYIHGVYGCWSGDSTSLECPNFHVISDSLIAYLISAIFHACLTPPPGHFVVLTIIHIPRTGYYYIANLEIRNKLLVLMQISATCTV